IIEDRTGVPVLGVLPYLRHLELDQEDSVDVDRFRKTAFETDTVNIAVVLLPHMSNFTDFNQLAAEPDVALRYVALPQELDGADTIVLPGSKTTIADLEHLRKVGFEEVLMRQVQRGGEIVGVCGGFQMLGKEITDPQHVETGGSSKGLGFLEVETELLADKTTVQVRAGSLLESWGLECLVEGYEIHMGATRGIKSIPSCFRIHPVSGEGSSESQEFRVDGAMSLDGRIWGTYIHGVFDQPEFRRHWLNRIRIRKGLASLDLTISEEVSQRMSKALDRWADHLEAHLDVKLIFSALGLGGAFPDWHHQSK
ncbi:MAG: cobyric acid synthase, partial [Nitrospira sp.]|nr:cobyric acid synthase [Nitrospira sp.]